MFIVRDATEKDVGYICQLLEQLGYEQGKENLQSRFEKFVSIDGYRLVVATDNGKVVGLLAWSKSILIISDKTRIRIEAMVVDKSYRGNGVGKQLMQYLEDIAMNYSPVIIELTSRKTRAVYGAHDFYDVLGYTNFGDNEKVYLRKEL